MASLPTVGTNDNLNSTYSCETNNLHQEFTLTTNKIGSPHFIPQALLDLTILDGEWGACYLLGHT